MARALLPTGGGKKKAPVARGPQGLPTVKAKPAPKPTYRAPIGPPTPKAPAFKPLPKTTKPFAKAQTQARAKSKAARRKVPSSPKLKLPPAIAPEKLTSAQRQRLVTQGRNALNRARGSQSVKDFYDTSSPRDRAAIQHLSRVDSYERRARGGVTTPKFVAKGTSARDSHLRLPFATVNVSGSARAVAGLTRLSKSNTPVAKFAKAGLGDIKTLGVAPFVGGYEVGAGAYEAIRHGDTKRLERLGKGALEGVEQEVKHPVKSFREHPVLTGLDVSGALSVVGHGAGAVARATGSNVLDTGLRGKLARAGSTERAPLALTNEAGSRLIHERKHSRDLGRKQLEKAADSMRKPLRDSKGRVVTHTLPSGRVVPVLKASDTEFPIRSKRQRLQDSRTDFAASRANSRNRHVREKARAEVLKANPTRKKARHRTDREIVPLALEGTARTESTALADLRAHRDKLAAKVATAEQHVAQLKKAGASKQTIYRSKVELAAAKERIALVDKFLDSNPSPARIKAVFDARAKIGPELNAGDRSMAKERLAAPKQLRKSKLFPYAQEHMGARYEREHYVDTDGKRVKDSEVERVRRNDPTTARALYTKVKAGLVDADGKRLGAGKIEAHMREHGVDPDHIAYLPHRTDVRGSRAFYSQFRGGGRPVVKNEARTGALYAKGATGTTFDTVVEHSVRQRTQIAKAQEVDSFIRDSGLKREDGRYFTSKEAAETAKRLADDTGEGWVPVSAVPAKLEKALAEAVKQGQDPRTIEGLSEKLLNSRIEFAQNTGKRNVVLVPKRMVDRLGKHAAPAESLERVAQYINRPFRFTVLAQPRWLTGNFVEPFLVRLPTQGSGIVVPGLAADLRAFRKLHKAVDASTRDAIDSELLNGLFIGNRGASNYRAAKDLPGVARYGSVIAHLPAVKQAAWFGRHAATIVGKGFFAANHRLEQIPQKAAVGRQARRDVQEFTGSWLKGLAMGDEAAKEAANGLVNTSTQQRYARYMDEFLGKYSRWSPTSRRLIQSVFPFVPWSLNSARFVYWTLPAHNSAKTAALIKAAAVSQEAWDEAHADTPDYAEDLKYAPRTKDGGYRDVFRYTPGGFTIPLSQGDFSGLQEPLLPQLSGVTKALAGKDPFGNDLVDSKGRRGKDTNTLGIAARQLYESVGGPLSMIRRLREGGSTGYADSTFYSPKVKPGTKHMSGIRRTLDPFAPVYLKSGKQSGRGGTVNLADPARLKKLQQQASSTVDLADPERLKRLLAGG
jgi:hypothetical protein